YVAQPDVVDRLKHLVDTRKVLEEAERFFDGHVQYIGDVLASIMNLQRLCVVACAAADLAIDIHIRQEVHLDALGPLPLARFASAALDVEAESASFVAAELGIARLGENATDFVEDARVRRRIRSWRSANG